MILIGFQVLKIIHQLQTITMSEKRTMLGLIVFVSVIANIAAYSINGPINSTLLDDLRQSALDRINFYRYRHQAGPVVLNTTLNAAAQNHTEYMRDTGYFMHSSAASAGVYGENIYMMGAGPTPITYNLNAVESWYSEVNNYNFADGTSSNGGVIGHFTAMMWNNVTDIGLGFASKIIPYNEYFDIAYVYVTLNLSPTPNYIGQYTQNVFPASR